MTYRKSKETLLLILISLVWTNDANAAQLIWHSYDLVNVPQNFQSSVGSTSVAIGGGGGVNNFPSSSLILGDPDYGLQAEVKLIKEVNNRLLLSTHARLKMANAPLYGGAWANANGYVTATFELIASPGDPATLDANVVIDLTGTYAEQSVTLSDTSLPPLSLGANAVTLNVGHIYTLNAFVYSVAAFQKINVEEIADAEMRMSITGNGIVSGLPPVADAGPDQSVYVGQTANLSAAGSTEPTGGTLSYHWSLDAAPAGSIAKLTSLEGMTTALTPDGDGQYTVSLVVNNGNQSSIADTVLIHANKNLPPLAVATATPITGDAPLLVQFDASASSDPENGALSFMWDFGDGSPVETISNPSHLYMNSGSVTALLTVTDQYGNTDQASVVVAVTAPNMPPQVLPTAQPASGIAPLTVQFFANAVDPEGAALKYTWDFGDGSPNADLADPTHDYLATGTYPARVTVSDGVASASATLTVTVNSMFRMNVRQAKAAFGKPGKVDGKVELTVAFTYSGIPEGAIRVNFDQATLFDAPFTEFTREEAGVYRYHTKNVYAKIDLNRGVLKVARHKMVMTGMNNGNGIDIVIRFGGAVASDHIDMVTRRHDKEQTLLYPTGGTDRHDDD